MGRTDRQAAGEEQPASPAVAGWHCPGPEPSTGLAWPGRSGEQAPRPRGRHPPALLPHLPVPGTASGAGTGAELQGEL